MSSHTFPIRVYYEDTDHGGVVYYANYLKFMERGRTEFLRSQNIELNEVHCNYGVMFAVTQANIRYLSSAYFNDALQVESILTHAHGARLAFIQRVYRQQDTIKNTLLVEADIQLACVDDKGKPCRIPRTLLPILEQSLSLGSKP